MSQYEVNVGNIGTVYDAEQHDTATIRGSVEVTGDYEAACQEAERRITAALPGWRFRWQGVGSTTPDGRNFEDYELTLDTIDEE